MTTQYPGSVDTNLTLPKVIDGISPMTAVQINQLQEAVLAVQNELGANPSGIYGTVADRIAAAVASTGELDASLIPIEDVDGYFDATNVEGALREIVAQLDGASEVSGAIGAAEDGDYSDGLFSDFTSATPVGTAVDRFNSILAALAPPPAPALSDISFTSSLGSAGKVSFGVSNAIGGYSNVSTDGGGSALDINGTFTSGSGTSLRKGIYASSGSRSGVVADAVVADTGTPNAAYPANSFGDADVGTLDLEVNGTIVHSVDLSVYASGSTLNGNGSGFSALSAATDTQFPSGTALDLFKYRTASWVVAIGDQRNGWNYMRVIHNNSPSFTRTSNYFEWVIDADATATVFDSSTLDNLVMSGLSQISGVSYHTGGSAEYDVTISNLHRNTYSSSASAISHPTQTNCTVASAALANITTQADQEIITNKSVTVAPASNSRILNGSIAVSTSVDRTVQSDLTSSTATITGLLVDSNADSATATAESFVGESFRLPSNRSLSLTTGFTLGGADLWNSALSLTSGGAGYSDGLLVYNGALYYPNNAAVANSGNFSTITNGPAGNVNYSAATGTRTFWRYFYFASSTSNFTMTLTGTGTAVAAGTVDASTNELSVEMLLPNTTQNGASTIEFKDCTVAYTNNDAIGCYAGTYGSNVGSMAGESWGLTAGSRSTATSGNAVVLRITVGQGWTGNITDITLVGA